MKFLIDFDFYELCMCVCGGRRLKRQQTVIFGHGISARLYKEIFAIS